MMYILDSKTNRIKKGEYQMAVLFKQGGSVVVSIPPSILESMDLKVKDSVSVVIRDNKIVIEKVQNDQTRD